MKIVGSHRYAQRLEAGEPSLACFSAIPDRLTVETLSHAGFDIVVVDLQHGGAGLNDLPDFVRAIELHGAAAFVRVSWAAPEAIMRAADAGVAGIIVPMIETREQAVLAAHASRYPPRGNRSFGPMRALRRPTADANDVVHVFPMIETRAALAAVDEIAAVDGVDGLFVGPVDLGLSLGLRVEEAFHHADVVAGLDASIAAAQKHGKLIGTVASDHEHARALVRRGVDWVGAGGDKGFIREGAHAVLREWASG